MNKTRVPALISPSHQAVEVLGGARVCTQRGTGHTGRSLGPVLNAVVEPSVARLAVVGSPTMRGGR